MSMATVNTTAKEKGPGKRAHKTLTIYQKLEIVDQIGKKSYKVLSEEYGVGVSTISDITKKDSQIRSYKRKAVEIGMSKTYEDYETWKKIKSWKRLCLFGFGKKEMNEYPLQVKHTYMYFIDLTMSIISRFFFVLYTEGPVVQAKARELHQKLCLRMGDAGSSTDFTASDGWLWRFSKRHGIRQLLLQGNIH